MPAWTSSKTSGAPTLLHASRAAPITSPAISKTPASPWTGSMMMASVRWLTAALSA
jgi:hypothetical protein